ncbi:MAG TPA: hypothetical protein DDW76_22195 [Cyanobacteria bacterium UBA11369]|nr:hypothetical protein [Cyanobacteria bacterium UBA11371]HBE30782.1 hypothetical protein [Cyanobacteria bacterium UBA11368]HBE51410.1 hypothetical protein [Cyanobacteria bacterium UBA11369]
MTGNAIDKLESESRFLIETAMLKRLQQRRSLVRYSIDSGVRAPLRVPLHKQSAIALSETGILNALSTPRGRERSRADRIRISVSIRNRDSQRIIYTSRGRAIALLC